MLRQRDAKSGLRNFEELDEIARQVNFQFEDDVEMPANNRLLYWRKMADS
jgi:hypothetical protein